MAKAGLVLLEPFLRAFPVPQAVDLLCSRLGPDADQVVAVQAVIHIDAVAVEMEVKDAGFAVRMECDDVLGIGWKMVGRSSGLNLCLALKILDLDSNFNPVTNLFSRNIVFRKHPIKVLFSLEQLRRKKTRVHYLGTNLMTG